MHPVFVLGAGFTKAFYEEAPLMEDDFGTVRLLGEFAHRPWARARIEEEIYRVDPSGGKRINLERLMTRVQGLPITAPLDVGVFTCAGSPGCIDGWTLAADGIISRFDSAGVRDVFTLPLGSPARLLTVP